ncbi:MAG: class I mannose-6-phosphate isomerase [Phycisphaerales bacterium]|nr:MAG: class I mannose-6-phosphate isomerase [Phycisphaerales bacterium]
MKPYPLLFEPLFKPKVWGGRALESLGKALPPDVRIGESWELADLPDSIEGGRSVIANGPLAGQTLQQAIAHHPEATIGAASLTSEGGFPLLIKYLDARENLSVQVHPPESYVREHPEAHLKSEAWVVIEAEPGAVIYKGVKPGLSAEVLARHLQEQTIVEDLIAVPVNTGDCHYLPCGTCHALGGGIVVAEIQTPSDTTFRLYDWGRTDRQLHIEQALACIDFASEPAPQPTSPPPIEADDLRIQRLVKTTFFEIERFDALKQTRFEAVTSGMPEVWMILTGAGRLDCRDISGVRLLPGTTTLLPAGLAGTFAHLEPATSFLRVTLPSPLEGMIA